MSESDQFIMGTFAENYERYLGPMLFEDLGKQMAQRAAQLDATSILEVAAGTGIATRYLAALLPPDVSIMVTDINQEMLDLAQRKLGSLANLQFRQADAMTLPFPDKAFDAVICQLGLMFVSDKAAAVREAARVLKPGGIYLFSVWDSIEKNDFIRTIKTALKEHFADGTPRFFDGPYGYYQLDTIRAHLESAGFHSIEMSIVSVKSPAVAAQSVAMGYLTGTLYSLELAQRTDISRDEAIARVTQAIAQAHGDPPAGAKIQAIFVSARVS